MIAKRFIVLVILVVGATTTRAGMPVYMPIANVSDPELQSLGRYAVEEYDKLAQSHLLFKLVFGADIYFEVPYKDETFAGQTLYLYLTATNCSQFGALGNYTAQLKPSFNSSYIFQGLKPKQS